MARSKKHEAKRFPDLADDVVAREVEAFQPMFEKALAAIVNDPSVMLKIQAKDLVSGSEAMRWRRYVKERDDLTDQRLSNNYGPDSLLQAIIRYVAHRDNVARTGGTTASELARLRDLGEDGWPDQWRVSARTIFEAYLTTTKTTLPGGRVLIDGVPLLRARMLAWSQHTNVLIRDGLRMAEADFADYVELWDSALRSAGRAVDGEVLWLVRVLGAFLDGMILDAALNTGKRHSRYEDWVTEFERSALALLTEYTISIT